MILALDLLGFLAFFSKRPWDTKSFSNSDKGLLTKDLIFYPSTTPNIPHVYEVIESAVH